MASISGDHQLARPELLRRLVQLFEPAVDDCLQWGAALPKVRSLHPVTDWPASPQEAQEEIVGISEPRASPFQVQVLGGGPVQLKLIDADEKAHLVLQTSGAQAARAVWRRAGCAGIPSSGSGPYRACASRAARPRPCALSS